MRVPRRPIPSRQNCSLIHLALANVGENHRRLKEVHENEDEDF
jgi:hypothetical protein